MYKLHNKVTVHVFYSVYSETTTRYSENLADLKHKINYLWPISQSVRPMEHLKWDYTFNFEESKENYILISELPSTFIFRIQPHINPYYL